MSTDSRPSDCRRTCDAASDYLDGHISDKNRTAFENHLDSCGSCADFVHSLQTTVGLLSDLREGMPSAREQTRAASSYDEYFPEPEVPEGLQDWTSAKEIWGKLQGMKTEDRRIAIRLVEGELSCNLCDWLMARAKQTSSYNPNSAIPLAEAALEIARQRAARAGDEKRLRLAVSVLAGCLVVLREFARASCLLEELGSLCMSPDISIEQKAAYYGVKGIYYAQVGKPDDSESYLERALALRRQTGNREAVVCELVNLAGTQLSADKASRAVSLCREAEQLLEQQPSSLRLQIAVYSSLVLALIEAENPQEARGVLGTVRRLTSGASGWYSRLYTEWLEGSLSFAEGRYDVAEAIFEALRLDFRSRRHAVWYVEASLDLARVYLRRKRIDDLEALSSELVVGTELLGADKHTRSAVLSFARAVKLSAVSGEVLTAVAVALNSARLRSRL